MDIEKMLTLGMLGGAVGAAVPPDVVRLMSAAGCAVAAMAMGVWVEKAMKKPAGGKKLLVASRAPRKRGGEREHITIG